MNNMTDVKTSPDECFERFQSSLQSNDVLPRLMPTDRLSPDISIRTSYTFGVKGRDFCCLTFFCRH